MYNCNSCGSTNYKALFLAHTHNIVQCTDCDLVYTSNPLSFEDALAHYEQSYSNQSGPSEYEIGEVFRLQEAHNRLPTLGYITSLLDVGCGLGFFVQAARARGVAAIGIDISGNAVEYGVKKNLNLRQGDLLNLQFSSESFDAITFWASLEHLYQPKKTLEKAHSLLKPGGFIAIETGDINSYIAKMTGSKWRLLQPDHNFYFSSATLDELLINTGFAPVRTDNDGFVEAVLTQTGLREFILRRFGQGSTTSKKGSTSLKELINKLAGKLHLGDVMIKYAEKVEA